MRVTGYSQQQFLASLHATQQELNSALERMSTGMRVRRPSDDPVAAEELARLADQAQLLTMRTNGISQARPWLQLTEQAVTELGTSLTTALTLAIQGASGTLTADERAAIAEQVAGLQDQVEATTQLRVGKRFIFSGTLTDTAPFDADGNYLGNENIMRIPLDAGTAAINIPGDQVFGTATAGPRKLLQDLEAALRTGTQADVQALVGSIRSAISDNTTTIARIGNMRKLVEDAAVRIEDQQLAVQSRANDIGAADLATAISDVQKFTQAHEATLAAGAKLFGPTFFDYIG